MSGTAEADVSRPRPGMEPHDLLFQGGPTNICRVCDKEFETWQGATDHQEDKHDGEGGIEIDHGDMVKWHDESEEFDWWVASPGSGGTERKTMELGLAMTLENHGHTVHLAEPIRGGPA